MTNQKYLSVYNNFRQLHLMNEGNYRVLYRKKWEYYGGKSDPEVYRDNPFDHKILKQDIPLYLESDEELLHAKQKTFSPKSNLYVYKHTESISYTILLKVQIRTHSKKIF